MGGKKGGKEKSGGVTEEQRGAVNDRTDDMASKNQYGFIIISLMVLMLGVSVAQLQTQPSLFRHVRKNASLKMDEAFLSVLNEIHSELILSVLSDECFQCWPQPVGFVPGASSSSNVSVAGFYLNTQHPLTLQLNSTPLKTEVCRVHFHFGEHGNYSLWVADKGNCTIVINSEPINSYLPILFAFLLFVGLYILAAVWNTLARLDCMRNLQLCLGSNMEAERFINSDLGSPGAMIDSTEVIVPSSALRRLRSLDTFRGFSLVVMVFVNYGGGRYWFFRHQSWNGLFVADLVFPWFVFIMGTSISLSVSSALNRGARRFHLIKKVFWRSVQLFIIGVFIINPNYCSGPLTWDSLRIPGVLQRLAFTYLVIATLAVSFSPVQPGSSTAPNVWWFPVHDIVLYWPSWLCVLTLEIIWLCLTFLLPVPGCPTGYLGPGGIGDFGRFQNCTGGAAAVIDRWLLGDNHMYQTPSSRLVYQTTVGFDPEGVLGSINSVLMAFLGLQAGYILLHYRDYPRQIMTRFLVWAFILGVISAVLTKCSKEHGFIPVNKNLWSLSYVTVLSCFAFVLLLGCYYVIDVKRWWTGAPFFYPGMNSILVYVGHEIFANYFPFRWKMANSQSHGEHLIQNLVGVSVWVIISFILYKKKIFWKI
ncbi:heparan-alpha-glucosaminide N-acetyltransferase [Trichomycterus rosablanca]|uniref:heparan-alpha-glucosaminide N-acetyltransferase n=1 Tax=Trichomycterus rosablanca TaxID=2290929 RepID=UPI002F360EFC